MRTLIALLGLLALISTNADARSEGGGKPQPSNVAIAGAAASAKAQAGAIAAQKQSAANTTTVNEDAARLAPGFGAPGLAASDEACMGSTSGGVGVTAATIGISATFGTTWESLNCNIRMFAQQMRLAGASKASVLHLLANHPLVKESLVAGGDLKADPLPPPAAPAVVSPVSSGKHPACSPSSWASAETRKSLGC